MTKLTSAKLPGSMFLHFGVHDAGDLEMIRFHGAADYRLPG